MRDLLIGLSCFFIGAAFTWTLYAINPKPYTPPTISQATPGGHPVVKLPKPGESYEILGELPGLANFAVRYDNQFIRGGAFYAEEGAQKLKEMGIQTVISVTPTNLERVLCDKYDLTLIETPFENGDLPAAFVQDLVHKLKNCDKPVYVHCHGGTHRGGAIGIMYRIGCSGESPEKAIAEYEALGGDPHNKDQVLAESIMRALAGKQT